MQRFRSKALMLQIEQRDLSLSSIAQAPRIARSLHLCYPTWGSVSALLELHEESMASVTAPASPVSVQYAAPMTVRIEPSRGWFDLRLGEVWSYRELLYFFCLARRQSPVQTNRDWHRLGRSTATNDHGRLHPFLRTPRQASEEFRDLFARREILMKRKRKRFPDPFSDLVPTKKQHDRKARPSVDA
jgi:hypothetical protein